jgi:hypothetical protein
MNRIQIINTIIAKNNYKKYLEVGVNTPAQPGYSHTSINIEVKHGVDPNVDTTFKMTSDDFFAHNTEVYDIVFVDGLHIFDQAHRDIENALKFLSDNGTIVVHDCNPVREITQRPIRASSVWHGDVWKAILKLRMERTDIIVYTINADEGCTIIQKGSQNLYVPENITEDVYSYSYFKKHKKEILNLISVREFKEKMGIPATNIFYRLFSKGR